MKKPITAEIRQERTIKVTRSAVSHGFETIIWSGSIMVVVGSGKNMLYFVFGIIKVQIIIYK